MRALLVLLTAGTLLAATADTGVAQGWDHFYNLEFDEAIAVFTQEAAQHPDDAALQNHIAQSVLYRAMLKAGALESEMVTGGNSFLRREKMNPTPAEQRQFEDAVARAMALSRARLDRDPKDRAGIYNLGVSYALRSNYNFLVRKAWMDALRDATSARKLHSRLSEIDPDDVDARMLQGVHDYIVGSLSWYYRALGFVAGFHGDREAGIRTLQLVAAKGNSDKLDAKIMLAVIYRREQRSQEAIPLLEDLTRQFPRNYILRLETAQMYSDLGNKDLALAALAEVEKMKRAGLPGYSGMPLEKVYYFRGNLQFWYDDLDAAIANLKVAAAKAEDLDPNTGVMTWMRLGQTYDLKGERKQAIAAYRHAIAYAPDSEAAKESAGYIRDRYRRKS